ncbi:hypothetical protein CMU89_17075 [Elizabethkingia anophelis]|nr:hypothetical protein [Elizabethkingia anophelis]MDV3544354.1 hypothetical protein [Elizabethkingia anophelis]
MKQIFALFKTLSVMFILIVVCIYSSIKLHDFIIQVFDITYKKDDNSFAYVITLFLAVFIVVFIMGSILTLIQEFIYIKNED